MSPDFCKNIQDLCSINTIPLTFLEILDLCTVNVSTSFEWVKRGDIVFLAISVGTNNTRLPKHLKGYKEEPICMWAISAHISQSRTRT